MIQDGVKENKNIKHGFGADRYMKIEGFFQPLNGHNI